MTQERTCLFGLWQRRVILFSAIGYAFFYLVRKNLSMAQAGMLEEGVISLEALGSIMTAHGLLYGASRFVNGFWADRVNARVFMALGLVLSAVLNLLFGCMSLTALFALFWIVNGWTQGMGFPPCTKMLTHWIHPKELATKMSLWNASHSVGAIMALGLCSLLLGLGFNWRWCFWIPSVLALAAAALVFFMVRETPTEAGLEEIEVEKRGGGEGRTITSADRYRLVFGNKVIWIVSIANFFVYSVRFGFLDWGPTFLMQFKGIPVAKGGLMIIAFELAAVVGTVFAGWVTDKVFKGRGQRTCVFCMLFAALFSFAFWWLPAGAPGWQATLILMGAGFCIYGPQALAGIITANQATKDAAALATGFSGVCGYLSTTVSGIGLALVSKYFGWGVALATIAALAAAGMVLFMFVWFSPADGYGKRCGAIDT